MLAIVVGSVACTSAGERVARTRSAFTSANAELVDFDFDGKLVADTSDDARLRTLIGAQLMYSVGQLNGDRANGRHERLELTAITATASDAAPDHFDVTYHAKLPVAWAGATKPTTYTLILPAKVAEADQIDFAAKYGATCTDDAAGPSPIEAWRMFLFYRPAKAGCSLAADDVVMSLVTVTPSVENTTGKYPEYDRIWSDGILDVVAVFSRAEPGTSSDDEGLAAYHEGVARLDDWLRGFEGADTSKNEDDTSVTSTATLADGRRIAVHVRLVPSDLTQDPAFDGWYDARTPDADVILYNGHAGLGENVRSLMSKGTFRAGKYLLWSVNACDTFAYVDRTLADRRAKLNLDDPSGTKYMDTISNVMAGYFATSPATSVILLRAVADAADPRRGPKSYRQIFEGVDPEQVIAVTGEEDNEFVPSGGAGSARSPVSGTADTTPFPDDDEPTKETSAPPRSAHFARCGMGPTPAHGAPFALVLFGMTVALVSAARRRALRALWSRSRGRPSLALRARRG